MTSRFMERVERFRQTPEGYAQTLRQKTARAIISRMQVERLTQERMAGHLDMAPGRLSRILDGDVDLRLSEVGRILHKLGVRPSLDAWEVAMTNALEPEPLVPIDDLVVAGYWFSPAWNAWWPPGGTGYAHSTFAAAHAAASEHYRRAKGASK